MTDAWFYSDRDIRSVRRSGGRSCRDFLEVFYSFEGQLRCPLRVICGGERLPRRLPICPQKQDITTFARMPASLPGSVRGDDGGVVRWLLACARARPRRRTERSAPYRKGAGRPGKWRRSWRKNGREHLSRRLDDPRARIWTWDAGSREWWDAGSRQRRRLILQRTHLRRQQGELTGYSFQIRLLG
jgi:hypothetical protein